ncbi:glycosyltransferase [bacterium]|nr:glycosyltransferase [bacterium]
MTASGSLHVLLPAFNEAESLPALLPELARVLAALPRRARVVVVDDGSSDGTAEVARRHGTGLDLQLVRHPQNQGLGSALRDGLRYVLADAPDDAVVVVMDADDSHPPALIPRLLDGIDAGADVVIASRFRRGARLVGIPWRRRILSRGASLLLALLAPVRGVRDATGGFRAYRASALRRAAAARGGTLVAVDGFGCMVDVLLALDAVGARVSEVPIELRYDRKRSTSKMPIWATVRETIRLARGRRR